LKSATSEIGIPTQKRATRIKSSEIKNAEYISDEPDSSYSSHGAMGDIKSSEQQSEDSSPVNKNEQSHCSLSDNDFETSQEVALKKIKSKEEA
jgi:hypothetical protein